MLTVRGIECAFELGLDQDRVPLTLQVVQSEMVPCDGLGSPVRLVVTLSDGSHRSPFFFTQQLFHLGHTLRAGAIVTLHNYISQRLDDTKVVVICLNVSVVADSVEMIGNPSDFVIVPECITEPAVLLSSSAVGFCKHCQQNSCDWSIFGRTIVDCVRSTIGSTAVDKALINKQYRFAAYQMYTRAKLGYLGKGNRVPLPLCVSDAVRNNFPDPNHSYVGFISRNN